MITPPLSMSRPVLCARIHTLRNALDLLVSQAAVDGRGSFACRGTIKGELIGLEAQLRAMDGRIVVPPHISMLGDQIVAHQGSRRVG